MARDASCSGTTRCGATVATWGALRVWAPPNGVSAVPVFSDQIDPTHLGLRLPGADGGAMKVGLRTKTLKDFIIKVL